MEVRDADPGELPEIASVLDAACLRTDRLREAVGSGDVLAASSGGPVLGALVLDGVEITAVAVRPGRRGQGVGTALVTATTDRRRRLVAEFDPSVRPFWESVGFELYPLPDSDRIRGISR